MFNFNSTEKDQKITALEERIKTLEQQNASIMQEMRNMCAHYNQHIERLERRITDFTDVWHPMMTANIVRIKDELVAETMKDSQLYIDQRCKTLLPAPSEKKQENCMDPLSGCVVIGFVETTEFSISRQSARCATYKPVFAKKNSTWLNLTVILKNFTSTFIVDSIASFPEIKKIDLADLVSSVSNADLFHQTENQIVPTKMVDIDGNVICSSPMHNGKLEYSRVEKLDKAFAKYGVELLYEGKPIRLST
jgi:hypothetical protein